MIVARGDNKAIRHSSESWNLPGYAAVEKKSEIPAFAGMADVAGIARVAWT